MPTSARAAGTAETRYSSANSMVPFGPMWASAPTWICVRGRRKPKRRLGLRFGKEETALENKRRRLRRLVSSKPFLTRASAPTSPRKAGFRKTENPAPKQGRDESRYHPDLRHLRISVSQYRANPAALVARPLGTGCTRSQRKGSHLSPSLLARLLRMLGLSSR